MLIKNRQRTVHCREGSINYANRVTYEITINIHISSTIGVPLD